MSVPNGNIYLASGNPAINKCCTCGKCWRARTCDDSYYGGVGTPDWDTLYPYDNTYSIDQCCQCNPRNLCVILTISSGDAIDLGIDPQDLENGYRTAARMTQNCGDTGYAGTLFIDNNGQINLDVELIRNSGGLVPPSIGTPYSGTLDYYKCWWGVRSTYFNTVGLGTSGVVAVPTWGTGEYSLAAKESGCKNWEFSLNIPLSGLPSGVGNTNSGILSFKPDNMVDLPKFDFYPCYSPKITVDLFIPSGLYETVESGGKTFSDIFCIDSTGNLWSISLTKDDYSISTFSLLPTGYLCAAADTGISWGVSGIDVEISGIAGLPSLTGQAKQETICDSFYAKWLFESGIYVEMEKTDECYPSGCCDCVCGNACITFQYETTVADPPPTLLVGTANLYLYEPTGYLQDTCLNCPRHVWSGTLFDVQPSSSDPPYTPADPLPMLFWIECGCVPEKDAKGGPKMYCNYPGIPDGSNSFSITCPMEDNEQWITFPSEEPGYPTGTIIFQCEQCIPCQYGQFINTPCCSGTIPSVLYLEVICDYNCGQTDVETCSGDLIGTVIPLIFDFSRFFDSLEYCWHGTNGTCPFGLRCNAGQFEVFYDGDCTSVATLTSVNLISCNPFIIEAEGAYAPGNITCCEEGQGSIGVRITE